ncbi:MULTISPECIES: phage shock protein operon transcriptional activator [unclassified Colwellia]|jgi:psp operon transcriptional activator|uniref:phage shock protein operon transcriptional activator n=1 Tax=unclassified Colwellia TaxID=196834 RepID=UPI0015F39802|nr:MULTISPECIES: phage shock protein operon transcriptional activator [unclassified Colwellia]MBA6338147.1 phage shock protein operon transcriptional activator [Colwellia sp. BRX8-7]MBA6355551.1 phage shock protein operon transcriptional activator [Colwellia sp. BRX8-3]MBA6358559.1 phage shock protein operon transcriptional activator [Colwellia sp. BRX8-6]MBA6366790.1 phage shock protein operon transcriptional activator [Colwellia sp. BRX8-5]MBA6373657.1 phage shock protein operon transcriptio
MSRFNQKDNLLGQANNFLEVLEQVSQVAPLSKPVLIIGERGTGKELIAARLHYLSKRWDQNYLKLNCAALNENLLETELFGYDSGAFTGASKRHEGRFERADNGTLFLDEIANTSGLIQEKLLRVVEYGEFERVGGSRTINTNVRLIAATNEDLPTLADAGEFRADLLDRLAFDVITLPPLRERTEDIMMLAESFAINMARELEFELFSGFTEKAKRAMLEYHWPGNVRELKNVVERSVYRCNNPHLPVHDLVIDPFESPYRPSQRIKTQDRISVAAPSVDKENKEEKRQEVIHQQLPVSQSLVFPLSLKDLSQDYEIDLIQSALENCQYNQKKTADALKLTYHQLRGYLKKYNLLESAVDEG